MEAILNKYEDVGEDDVFSQYVDCFREVLTQLILESYDVAAYVYQKHCVEGLSIEKMMKTTRLSEDALNMFVKYFDARHNQDN